MASANSDYTYGQDILMFVASHNIALHCRGVAVRRLQRRTDDGLDALQ